MPLLPSILTTTIFPPPRSLFETPSFLDRLLLSPLKTVSQYFIQPLLLHLQSSPNLTSPADIDRPVTIACISDTHTHEPPNIPPADVLIHAGDLVNDGTAAAIQKQLNWLGTLISSGITKHVIVIAGNHDSYFDPRSRRPEDVSTQLTYPEGMHYLQHSSITLPFPPSSTKVPSHRSPASQNGNRPSNQHRSHDSTSHRTLKFYGAPQIPACGGTDFAFQYPRGMDSWTGTVPTDTDVLITHTPPKHHLDLPHGMGCEWLLREWWRVKPKLLVCAHVHEGRGKQAVWWDRAQVTFEQICVENEGQGLVMGLVLDWRSWIALVMMVVYGIWAVGRGVLDGATGWVWRSVWGGEVGGNADGSKGGWIINAAMVIGSTGKCRDGKEAIVVQI